MNNKLARALPLSILIGLLFVHSVKADQTSDSGFYISGGIGQNRIQSGIPEETTTVLNAAVGWQFNPGIALELSYNDLGKFPGPTPAFTDFDLTGVAASVVGHLPISTDIAFFARAGLIWWSADSSFFFFGRNSGINQTGILNFSESDFLLGLGASYELSEELEVDLEFNHYDFGFPSNPSFNNTQALRQYSTLTGTFWKVNYLLELPGSCENG